MLLATMTLASRIEHAESTLVADTARAIGSRLGGDGIYIGEAGGGAAVFAGPGSPFSKFAGLGFQPLDEADLTAVEREFERRGSPLRVELATLADPQIGALLTSRGYQLQGFENVLGLPLDANGDGFPAVPGIAVTEIQPDESSAWIDAVVTGFLHPDTFDGPAAEEAPDRQMLEQVFSDTSEVRGFARYIVRRDGAVAGGGGLRMWNGIAQLCGAATLPAHRRRGVQTALLQYRLRHAARSGADVAVVTTQPGSKSQENVQRLGFELLYARAVLVKK